jgi:hypothetical protein
MSDEVCNYCYAGRYGIPLDCDCPRDADTIPEPVRMKCRNGHMTLKVEILCKDENWITISCMTCGEPVWYNGA